MEQLDVYLDSQELNEDVEKRGANFEEDDNLSITLENCIDSRMPEVVSSPDDLIIDVREGVKKYIKAKEFVSILFKIINETEI